ncbi:family 43 glycosylhydrolase [Paenibacillus xylanexedens]|uniref:family 43 glycosylhydrolase n=1 Tax=Paenibacillus xylanexedens TaxID=528191 RepID=UPI003D08ED15
MIKGKSWMAIVIALMLLTVHLTSSAQTVHAAGEETHIAATLFVLKTESEVSNAKIHWAPVQGATAYELYRSENDEPYQLLQTLTGTTSDDYDLNIGSSYKYQVKAYGGTSLLTSAVSPEYTPYSLPENLTTFDNTTQSTLMLSNELKVGDTYYRFNFAQKSSGGFGEMIQQTSTDDISYGNDKVVLSYTDHPDLANSKFEGINILYHAPTNKFVFWAHYENSTDYTLARVSVASATPGEDFTFHKSFRPEGNQSRDISIFKDDDDSAYLISTANNNSDTILYKLTSDWLDVDHQVSVIYQSQHRELPKMIKKDGIYYLFSSQAAGWYPSIPLYSSANSIDGDWSELRTIGNTSTFSAQSGSRHAGEARYGQQRGYGCVSLDVWLGRYAKWNNRGTTASRLVL